MAKWKSTVNEEVGDSTTSIAVAWLMLHGTLV